MLVRSARLLDVDVAIAYRVDDAQRIVDPPARVRVGDEHFSLRKHVGRCVYALDVVSRVAADLELEFRVTVRAVPGNVFRHLTGRPLADCAVQRHAVTKPAADKIAHRFAADLAE